MKFIIDNWYLIFVALASGSMLLWPVLKNASGGSLTPARAVQLINREKAVVIDVCETEEFASGHVNGAKNVPLGQLEERLPTVVKNKALPVVLVCALSDAVLLQVGVWGMGGVLAARPEWALFMRWGYGPRSALEPALRQTAPHAVLEQRNLLGPLSIAVPGQAAGLGQHPAGGVLVVGQQVEKAGIGGDLGHPAKAGFGQRGIAGGQIGDQRLPLPAAGQVTAIGRQIIGAHRGQATAEAADGGANRVADKYVTHQASPGAWPWAAAVRASRSRRAVSSTSLGATVVSTLSAKRIAQPVAATICSRVTPG